MDRNILAAECQRRWNIAKRANERNDRVVMWVNLLAAQMCIAALTRYYGAKDQSSRECGIFFAASILMILIGRPWHEGIVAKHKVLWQDGSAVWINPQKYCCPVPSIQFPHKLRIVSFIKEVVVIFYTSHDCRSSVWRLTPYCQVLWSHGYDARAAGLLIGEKIEPAVVVKGKYVGFAHGVTDVSPLNNGVASSFGYHPNAHEDRSRRRFSEIYHTRIKLEVRAKIVESQRPNRGYHDGYPGAQTGGIEFIGIIGCCGCGLRCFIRAIRYFSQNRGVIGQDARKNNQPKVSVEQDTRDGLPKILVAGFFLLGWRLASAPAVGKPYGHIFGFLLMGLIVVLAIGAIIARSMAPPPNNKRK